MKENFQNDNARIKELLDQARRDAGRNAAASFSSSLENLARHASKQELSAIEIIEALREAAEIWDNRSKSL